MENGVVGSSQSWTRWRKKKSTSPLLYFLLLLFEIPFHPHASLLLLGRGSHGSKQRRAVQSAQLPNPGNREASVDVTGHVTSYKIRMNFEKLIIYTCQSLHILCKNNGPKRRHRVVLTCPCKLGTRTHIMHPPLAVRSRSHSEGYP